MSKTYLFSLIFFISTFSYTMENKPNSETKAEKGEKLAKLHNYSITTKPSNDPEYPIFYIISAYIKVKQNTDPLEALEAFYKNAQPTDSNYDKKLNALRTICKTLELLKCIKNNIENSII
jgi:hypothetical protein